MGRCKTLWASLKSPAKRKVIANYLGCNLQRPVLTNWTSLYDCLKQIYELKEKLMDDDAEAKMEVPQTLQEEDFDYIKEYLEWSKPLVRAFEELQAEENCYYGYFLPTLISIRRIWTKLLTMDSIRICKPLIADLISGLETRYGQLFNIEGIGEMSAIASLLHPKFKASWLPCLSAEAQEKVKKLAENLFRPEKPESPPTLDGEGGDDDFFDFREEPTSSTLANLFVPQDENENELMRYLNQTTATLDLLESYPTVKQLFVKYNALVPSSMPVQKLFSPATMQTLYKFRKIDSKNLEKRIMLTANSNDPYL